MVFPLTGKIVPDAAAYSTLPSWVKRLTPKRPSVPIGSNLGMPNLFIVLRYATQRYATPVL